MKLGYMPSLHKTRLWIGQVFVRKKNLPPHSETQVYEATVRRKVFHPRSGAGARER
ncbi:hypothetical protein EMIT093MI4_20023 [Pseudomonas sp. IT-93MI4]